MRDYKLVWETIKSRVPAIKPLLSQILEDIEP